MPKDELKPLDFESDLAKARREGWAQGMKDALTNVESACKERSSKDWRAILENFPNAKALLAVHADRDGERDAVVEEMAQVAEGERLGGPHLLNTLAYNDACSDIAEAIRAKKSPPVKGG